MRTNTKNLEDFTSRPVSTDTALSVSDFMIHAQQQDRVGHKHTLSEIIFPSCAQSWLSQHIHDSTRTASEQSSRHLSLIQSYLNRYQGCVLDIQADHERCHPLHYALMSANVSPQLFQEICEALVRHHYRLRLQPGDTLTDRMLRDFFDSFCQYQSGFNKIYRDYLQSRTCVPGKPNEQVIDWIQANGLCDISRKYDYLHKLYPQFESSDSLRLGVIQKREHNRRSIVSRHGIKMSTKASQLTKHKKRPHPITIDNTSIAAEDLETPESKKTKSGRISPKADREISTENIRKSKRAAASIATFMISEQMRTEQEKQDWEVDTNDLNSSRNAATHQSKQQANTLLDAESKEKVQDNHHACIHEDQFQQQSDARDDLCSATVSNGLESNSLFALRGLAKLKKSRNLSEDNTSTSSDESSEITPESNNALHAYVELVEPILAEVSQQTMSKPNDIVLPA